MISKSQHLHSISKSLSCKLFASSEKLSTIKTAHKSPNYAIFAINDNCLARDQTVNKHTIENSHSTRITNPKHIWCGWDELLLCSCFDKHQNKIFIKYSNGTNCFCFFAGKLFGERAEKSFLLNYKFSWNFHVLFIETIFTAGRELCHVVGRMCTLESAENKHFMFENLMTLPSSHPTSESH